MLTYNMDVEERSTWLRATPGAAALAQPFYCTEAGPFACSRDAASGLPGR